MVVSSRRKRGIVCQQWLDGSCVSAAAGKVKGRLIRAVSLQRKRGKNYRKSIRVGNGGTQCRCRTTYEDAAIMHGAALTSSSSAKG